MFIEDSVVVYDYGIEPPRIVRAATIRVDLIISVGCRNERPDHGEQMKKLTTYRIVRVKACTVNLGPNIGIVIDQLSQLFRRLTQESS
jgi:hypothetical protein